MTNIPVLIVLLPLCSALLSLVLTKFHKEAGRGVVLLALGASLVMSVIQVVMVVKGGPIHYHVGGYAMPFGIEFVTDTVNGCLLILISVVSFITVFFARSFPQGEDVHEGGFNALMALLATGLLGMTATGDVFNLYVFLEVSSLSAYCLIALGGDKAVVAAYRYMMIGTCAATLYLVGIGILYANTGTLNMADMAEILNDGTHDDAMLIAMCCFIVAFGIKMAHFPFHAWQPSVHAYAEAGSKPIIAGVMFKVPGYAMFRYLFCVFGTDFKYFRYILVALGVIAVSGMLYGSIRAIGQNDVRKMFAYSSVTQMSYITLGFAIGTPIALAGSFLHIMGHAFMKGGLFMASGILKHKYGAVKLENLGRVYKDMPLTATLMTVASLSMVGIPPTVGFFSKWYLGVGAASRGLWLYLAILVISSLLNAIYFFRLLEKIYMQKNLGRAEKGELVSGEKAITIAIPVILFTAAIVLLGLFNVKIVNILLITLEGVGL